MSASNGVAHGVADMRATGMRWLAGTFALGFLAAGCGAGLRKQSTTPDERLKQEAAPRVVAASRASRALSPWPGERMLPPPSQYFFPVEAGALDSHADLQLVYGRFAWPGDPNDTNAVQFGAEGQLALFDRVQLGVNIPFVSHDIYSAGAPRIIGIAIGDMVLKAKVKLAGSSSGPFAVSAFVNALLPTRSPTSADLAPRDYAAIHGGVAASLFPGRLVSIHFDAAVWDLFCRDKTRSPISGFAALLLGVHAATRLSFLAPYLGFQMAVRLGAPEIENPPIDTAAPAIAVGLQLFPASIRRSRPPIPELEARGTKTIERMMVHVDLGCRIALSDGGQAVYAARGRAVLVLASGFRF